jgi:hypothetical protein
MVNFRTFLSRAGTGTSRFFNSTLPTVTRAGINFFNSSVVPTARRIHGVHSAISGELRSNPNVDERVKRVADKSSAFADLGLTKLTQGSDAINRVAGQIGLV